MEARALSLWCGTVLAECSSQVWEYHSLRLCVPVFFHMIIDWNYWVEWVCVYRQIGLVDWPLVQLHWDPGAADINTSGNTHKSSSAEVEQMESHLHTVFIIKLTLCSNDSECEYGKCHLNYTAFKPFKAITAECIGSQSSHIRGTNVMCLENNDQKSSSSLRMLLHWLVRLRIQLQSRSAAALLICPSIMCEKRNEPILIESLLFHQDK